MKQIIKITIIFLISFTQSSCDLISPKSPLFFCKLNGKSWTPKSDGKPLNGVAGRDYFAVYGSKLGTLNISVNNGKDFLSLLLTLKEPTKFKNGENLNIKVELQKGVYYISYGDINGEDLNINYPTFKFIINKIDNDLISGTFEFSTYNSWRKNTKFEFTKGEFNNLQVEIN
jgi:hypothetical protein